METVSFQGVSGLEIVGDVDGPENGPVVMLLHGGGQNRLAWKGSGAALARRGYRIRVATRRPHLAQNMQTFGAVGQVCAVQANLRYPESVRHALAKADHVVNLVGILQESGRQSFDGSSHAERPFVELDLLTGSRIGAAETGQAPRGLRPQPFQRLLPGRVALIPFEVSLPFGHNVCQDLP